MEPTTNFVDFLLGQSALGVIAAWAAYLYFDKRAENNKLREDHAKEIAAERKLNADLQEARLNEAKQFIEVTKSVRQTLDDFLFAIRGKTS
jgi:gas vesicle protein